MMFRRPLFAAALLMSTAVLGLSPALAQTTPVPAEFRHDAKPGSPSCRAANAARAGG